METICRNEMCLLFTNYRSDGCVVGEDNAVEECRQFSPEPIAKKWFDKGRESVTRLNPSGCCCKIDEDGKTILELCKAHGDYFKRKRPFCQQRIHKEEVMNDRTCENCRWYSLGHQNDKEGMCKRFPPVLIFPPSTIVVGPPVMYDNWCGEFTYKVIEDDWKSLIPWNELKYDYVARDADGDWFNHKYKPLIDHYFEEWLSDGDVIRINEPMPKGPDNSRYSLAVRPGKEKNNDE